MKYELKRKTVKSILIYSAVLAVGILTALLDDDIGVFGVFFGFFSVGFIINELVHLKDPKLTFDEKGFYIGEMRYSYSNIERISSHRGKYITYIKIIVDGEPICKFDTSYENANEFIKQLTLNGIEHNLFGG